MFKNFKLGVQLQYITGRSEAAGGAWIKRLGAAVKLGFLDIVSVAPGLDFDVDASFRPALSTALLFDFKYLEDLGAGDVLSIAGID